MIRVTIWNEFRHEKTNETAKALYPNGLHATIGEYLAANDEVQRKITACNGVVLSGQYVVQGKEIKAI